MPNSLISRVIRPMPARNPEQSHRAATPLELLFDLVFVIAIAAAAAGLHHAISADHAFDGIIRFCMAFFAIWWAWMNYTWFASAYDNDDAVFRILTMVIMGGALVIAASINQLFEHLDVRMVILGYSIMRFAMIALWLRAARHDAAHRQTAVAYAVGIFLAQLYWIALLFLGITSQAGFYALFLLGVVIELSVTVLAERKGVTPWHRHHIIERYGLLTIITLGETLLAATIALRAAMGDHFDIALVHIALSALVITFAMWWVYFTAEDHLGSSVLTRALTWGYGHSVVFASAAAVGAGFAVLVDVVTDHAKISLLAADYAVAVPLATFLLSLWFVRDRFCLEGLARYCLPFFAVLALLAPAIGLGLEGVAAAMALGAATRHLVTRTATAA